MSVRISRVRPARAVIAAVAAVTTLVGGLSPAAPGAAVQAASTSALNGLTSADAAASCWEVKQLHPSSGDGIYWLRTDTLQRPAQFYCDMTTDGGGWVLIGRGREGWTFRDYGQNTPQAVRDNVTGPAAFAPGALSTQTINGLLDGGHVKDLADGVRLRRARNTAGTTWQDLRWGFLDLEGWSWAVGGGHRLSTWSIDGSGGTGSNTKDSKIKMTGETGAGNRGASDYDAWFTYPWSGHGQVGGFSYNGGGVGGQNNATSYLWELASENHAIPFTQVFIRPQVSTGALTPIPDAGVPAQTLAPLLDDRPKEIAGGVTGVLKIGDSESHLDTPVLAITTFGDRVYVGGKFSDVRDTATGGLVAHPYLAAFDRTTGAWISSFDPDLDGTVWDLKVAGGRLIVAGQFTNVNGEPLTAGLAALDPITGAVDPGWRASMTLSGSSERPFARALDVEGDWIYVGGNFTQIQGLSVTRPMGRLGKVAVADGRPDNAFTPDVDGVPYDVDAADGRVYVVGDFDGVNGTALKGVAVLDWTTGAPVPGLQPPVQTAGNFERRYQQAVHAIGGDVWQGGSEHNTQAYASSDYGLLKSFVTSGFGGDSQALASINGVVYQGSHGHSWIYEDAVKWPGLDGYTRTDDYQWLGAFDAATHDYEVDWVPSLGTAYDEGAWELYADPADDCLWFGGDFDGGPYVNGQRQYLESFSKFCQRDTQAPTVPSNPSTTPAAGGGIQLNWGASSDDFPGFIGYEILRNDRVVSPLVYGSTYVDPTGATDDRYFIRAVDPAGNRSASTAVIDPGADTTPPTTPGNLQATILPDQSVDLTWTASTDASGIESYLVFRNGVQILVVPGAETLVNIAGLGPGSHWLQVRAVDPAGNQSFKTPPVRVDRIGPDVQAPSTPGSPAASYDEATGLITLTWTASIDDTGVEGYVVRRNLVEVASVDGATLSVDLDLGVGGHYLQVEAFDAAGNTSFRTAPVFIEVPQAPGPDTTKPSTPGNLAAVVLPDGTIDVSWDASTDNVGVVSYRVLRNLVEVAMVPGTETATNLDLGPGSHWIQVQALDAAGNESFRTPPVNVVVVVAGPDTTPPTTPGNVAAVAQPDGTILVTWTPSTDNVGVASYRVLRNLVEVDLVDGAETQAVIAGLGAGNHYMQVQAIDAAGNESFRSPPALVTI